MAKYISYIFTCGGNAGARFSNGPEWHSGEGQLLFDASIWTMESIKEAIRDLYKKIDERSAWCHTLSDKMDNMYKYLDPFVDNTDGVYGNADYRQSEYGLKGWHAGNKENKNIHPTEADEIESWNMNGSTRNYDYDR